MMPALETDAGAVARDAHHLRADFGLTLRPRSGRAEFWAGILTPLYEAARIIFGYKHVLVTYGRYGVRGHTLQQTAAWSDRS